MTEHFAKSAFAENHSISALREVTARLLADSVNAASGCLSFQKPNEAGMGTIRECGFPQLDIGNQREFQQREFAENARPVIVAGRREAIQQANDHLGELVNIAAQLPPGKIDIASKFALADSLGLKPETILAGLGLQSDAKSIAMLRNVQSIEKTAGGHVVITQKCDQILPLNVNTGHGRMDDIHLDKTVSFDLNKNSIDGRGAHTVSNIQGVSLDAYGGLPARKLHSRLETLDVCKDAEGKTTVKAEASNPEHFWEKIATGDFGDKIPVAFQLQNDGEIVIIQHGKKTPIANIG